MMHRQFPWGVRCAPILVTGLLILANGCDGEDPDRTVALDPEAEAEPEDEEEVDVEESIGTTEASNEIGKLKQRKKGMALHKHLSDEGFKPGGNPNKDFYGKRTKYKNPDKPNVKTTHTIVLQNYEKEGSTDAGALGTVTLTTKEGNQTQTTTYDFVLVAPDGNFDNPIEHTATDAGTVVPANSWYSCVKSRVFSKCEGPCVTAVTTCSISGTWAAYLACVAIPCGYCLTKALACCSCDCSWWCKWGVGCCDR